MRIVITSSPKTGNHWIKCLLAQIYGLEWISAEGKPPTTRAEEFRRWVEAGNFPDGSIFPQHCRFSSELAHEIESAGAHLVTIVRNPYDLFVSLYYWVPERDARELGRRKARPRNALTGKPLDHPDVLAYLEHEFGTSQAHANGLLHSGQAVVVRHEGLHREPTAELKRATDRIGSVGTTQIELAIESCQAENMRQLREKMQWHVRSATTGAPASGSVKLTRVSSASATPHLSAPLATRCANRLGG